MLRLLARAVPNRCEPPDLGLLRRGRVGDWRHPRARRLRWPSPNVTRLGSSGRRPPRRCVSGAEKTLKADRAEVTDYILLLPLGELRYAGLAPGLTLRTPSVYSPTDDISAPSGFRSHNFSRGANACARLLGRSIRFRIAFPNLWTSQIAGPQATFSQCFILMHHLLRLALPFGTTQSPAQGRPPLIKTLLSARLAVASRRSTRAPQHH